MSIADLARLVSLGAIWGSSFIFMKILAPFLGAALTANLRLFIAGLMLFIYFRIQKFDFQFKKYWKEYALIGLVNSAIPFFMFSFAALHIPASYSVMLNSTAPLFGVIFSFYFLSESLDINKLLGVLIGTVGVAFVVGISPGAADVDAYFQVSLLACLIAAMCYAMAGIIIKLKGKFLKPQAIAVVSQLFAAAFLVPVSLMQDTVPQWSLFIILNLLGLALLCSAIAYLLYYRLLSNVGPTKALMVTFLMPVFGMLWANIFLGEIITVPMIVGALFIFLGIWFTNFSPLKIGNWKLKKII